MKANDTIMPSPKLPTRQRKESYIPTDKDIKTLIEAVKDTELYVPVLLATFGPMRRSEICGADIKDIDGNVLHVQRAMVIGDDNKYYIKGTKSYAGDRYIELPEKVIKIIQDQGYITHNELPRGKPSSV